MTMAGRQAHWEKVYASKAEDEVSWFQESPAPSLELITETSATPASAIVDIGGGASRLVDALVEKGFQALTVLDISEAALATAKARLGDSARPVQWIAADVTLWRPAAAAYDIWHDRATFHFLVDDRDRGAYIANMAEGVKPGGYAIIGTFALDGPERCSGLPVARYDAHRLGAAIGSGFHLVRTVRHEHVTPWGARQQFQFGLFHRRG
jgi:SAM-dependent methyltransferase